MNLVKVAEAIQTRLKADTGTGGLFNVSAPLVTGSHFCDATEAVSYPYIVFSIEAAPQEGTLIGSEVYQVYVDFHVYSPKTNGFAPVSSIIDRIYGDGYSQSGGLPSFGFQRHPLTVSGGWNGSPLVRVDMAADLEDKDVFHFRESYRFVVSR